jgi:hypothetical protein
MAIRQYIGARYVPIFGRKGETSIQWDNSAPYEPLTIVLYQGNSYTSRQFVPAGIDITNEEYWAETGNYNAQVEQYRQEVMGFDDDITQNTADIVTLKSQLAGTSESGLKTSIDANTAGVTTLNGQMAGTSESGLKTSIDANTRAIQTLSDFVNLGNVYSGKKSIGFGDSNMKGVSTGSSENDCVYHQICDFLGCTYDNRGVNGARWDTSYTGSEGSFLNQVQNATYDADVRLVVIIGGINDYHYSTYDYAAFSASINSTVDAALSKFPNADVCLVWDQGQQHPNARMLRYQECISGKVIRSRTRKIVSVPTFDIAYGGSSYYASQNHWNASGCRIVAERACSILVGGSPMRTFVSRVSVQPTDVTGALAVVELIPDIAACSVVQHADIFLSRGMRYNDSNVIPAFTTMFELPMGISARLGAADMYFYGNVINRSGATLDAKALNYVARQFESNYLSFTESPVTTIRNAGEWTWSDADCGFQITQTLLPWTI